MDTRSARPGPCLALLALCAVTPAAAADATNRLPAVHDVVVTATRLPERLLAVPASVTVIDGPAIRGSAARNPDDLLRLVPGVSVMRSTGMGHGLPSQINIRGVPGTQRTLLLADGFPLNEASTRFLNLHEMPLAAVRRIEVVRGPFSALYGTDACAGVINILTLDPEDLPFADLTVAAGNAGYRRATLSSAAGSRELGYALTVDARRIANCLAHEHVVRTRTDAATGATASETVPARNYDYRDWRVFGKFLARAGDEGTLVIHARCAGSDLGYGQADLRPFYPTPEDSITKTASRLVGAEWTDAWSDALTTRLAAYVRGQDRELWGLDPAGREPQRPVYARTFSDQSGRDARLDGLVRWTPGESHTLLAGLEVCRNACEFSALRAAATGEALPYSAARRPHAESAALYLQDERRLARGVSLVAGVRADWHSGFTEAVSPKAGLQAELTPATRVRASAGRAFRAPTLVERYQPDLMVGTIAFRANPALEPETITAGDIALDHRFSETLRLQVEAFYNDMDDLIANRVAGSVMTYRNVEQAWSGGASAELDWRAAGWLSLFANGTRQTSRDRATRLDLDYIPETMANAGLRLHWQSGAWSLGGALVERYTGDRGYRDWAGGGWQPLDPYWRTDASLRAGYRDTFFAGVTVENLTNTRYQESRIVNPAPGRLVAVEIGLRY